MEAFEVFFTLICILAGLLIVCRPLIKWILDKNKGINKQIELAEKYHKTALWKELAKLIGNSITDENLNFEAIGNRFDSYEEISKAIKSAGLQSCGLVIGIDFTASNEWQGRKTFEHKSLHHLYKNSKRLNPYQKVITAMGETLSSFDSDNLIPAFGFGDKTTKDLSVFSLDEDGMPCKGFEGVLSLYNEVVQRVELSGPTSFAPIIRKAIEITRQNMEYHILLVIADGQVIDKQDMETRKAIVEASTYPLSIVVVGVGDGPWDRMAEYDEKLPKRKFDNFQFVDYHRVTKKAKNPGIAFALNALMEIPDQYTAIKSAGLLRESTQNASNKY